MTGSGLRVTASGNPNTLSNDQLYTNVKIGKNTISTDGELAPLVFANIRNGLPPPVYLRRPKHTGLGKAASELMRALRAEGSHG